MPPRRRPTTKLLTTAGWASLAGLATLVVTAAVMAARWLR